MKTHTLFCLLALCSSLEMLVTANNMAVTEEAANLNDRELKKWWPKGKGKGKGTIMKSGMYYKMNVFHGYNMNGKGMSYKGKSYLLVPRD